MASGSLLNKVNAQREGLRDYRHASKTFVSNNLSLHPKYSFLFHVFIQLNPALVDSEKVDAIDITEISLMVKSVDLPNFTIDTKTFNAYNRPNIVQNKIKYEPVTITFHDDSSNAVRDLWADYYSYYYRDIAHTDEAFYEPNKYSITNSNNRFDWGFTPRQIQEKLLNQERYIKSIRIFSFHLGRFSEYQLFNPIITNWKHGKHNQSDTSGLLEHSMTFQYEGLHYSSGDITTADGQITSEMLEAGFSMLKYDQETSPLRQKIASGSIIGRNLDATRSSNVRQFEGIPNIPMQPMPGLSLPRINLSIPGIPVLNTALRAVQFGTNRIVVPTPLANQNVPTAEGIRIVNTYRTI